MIVTLDGQRIDSLPQAGSTLEKVIEHLRTTRLGERIVITVAWNGRDLTGTELTDRLGVAPGGDDQLDLESAMPCEVSAMALREVADQLRIATDALPEIANGFHAGGADAALAGLSSLLGVWANCQHTLGDASKLLGRDLGEEEFQGARLTTHLQAVADVLRSVREAVQNRDYVLLADLIEYEMPGVCTLWQGAALALADRVSQPAFAS